VQLVENSPPRIPEYPKSIKSLLTGYSCLHPEESASDPQGHQNAQNPGKKLSVIDLPLRFLKYVVLAWAVVGAAYTGYTVFRDIDPWAAMWNLAALGLGLGTVVLAITLVASLFVGRPGAGTPTDENQPVHLRPGGSGGVLRGDWCRKGDRELLGVGQDFGSRRDSYADGHEPG
jgi:hypothetical protein